MESLKTVGETVEGMFTFTYMDSRENLYIIKNDSPLTILHFPTLQLYVYASTDDIIFNALSRFNKTKEAFIDMVIHGELTVENIPIKAGDILIIKPNGKLNRGKFKPRERTWNNPLYSVAGCYYGYEYYYDSEDDWYRDLLLDEALSLGLTEQEFNKLSEMFSFNDLEYYIYTGRVYEVMADLGM